MVQIKWNRDKNGGCEFIKVGNMKYFITDELLADRSISNYWHIEKKQIIDQHKVKYKTYVEMLNALFGQREKGETEAYWSIRTKTNWANVGYDSLRTFDEDGRHFAVDLNTKESWEYTKSTKASPDFRTVNELKTWADEYLNLEQGLF